MMTEQQTAQLVLMIEAHWPHPAMDEVSMAALARALQAVPFSRIEQAVDRLVTQGREFQPRAPQMFKALAELDAEERRANREMEWAARQSARALEAPPEAREELAAVGRDLVEQLRRKAAQAGLGAR